ncbi:MAG TPA: MarR family transcriptional regulator [Rhodocyclaceae bacterium]|nr:MarR family transcriptional regulator [Rhodocyclaceae bacterium]
MKSRRPPSPKAAASAKRAEAAPFYDGAKYDIQRSVGYWTKRAYGSLQRSLDARMQPLDLTGLQWGPLLLISRGCADTVAACARESGNDAGAMTRMLDRLEAKDLLLRERSTLDRRVVNVTLTERGQAIAAQIPFTLAEVLNQHLRGFSEAEFKQFLDLLQRFVRNGEAADPTATGDDADSAAA